MKKAALLLLVIFTTIQTKADSTVEIISKRCDQTRLFIDLVGEIKNAGSEPIESLTVEGTFRNNKKELVTTKSGTFLAKLEPGQTAAFKVSTTKNTSIELCEVAVSVIGGSFAKLTGSAEAVAISHQEREKSAAKGNVAFTDDEYLKLACPVRDANKACETPRCKMAQLKKGMSLVARYQKLNRKEPPALKEHCK